MRVVFAGTSAFAVPCLSALLSDDSVHVVGVYTQPDRRSGRGQKLCHSAVKQFTQAHGNGTPLFQVETFHATSALAELRGLKPDLMIVVAYGLLLPTAVLAIPRLGCLNLHASLLPRWRGAAPIQRAIEAGDHSTGVSLMQIEQGLDRGAILAHTRLAIAADDTSGQLHDKLSHLAAQLLVTNLAAIAARELQPRCQDDCQTCYANKLQKAESILEWQLDAASLERKIRAFNPWPVARTKLNGNWLLMRRAAIDHSPSKAQPGEIIQVSPAGITVATGEGRLVLCEVQKPGGAPMSVAALLNGKWGKTAITRGMRFTTATAVT